jgi:Zn-dependent peptidase ImmA (M78 family)
MNSARREQIEALAIDTRKHLEASGYGVKDIFTAAEELGYFVVRYPLENSKLLGFSQVREGARIVFSNSKNILSREIFTVAHEIGHQLLHINEQDCPLIKDYNFSDSDELEAEANHFASCFLLPRAEARQFINTVLKIDSAKISCFDIARIQTEFNCSYDMLLNRLSSLGHLKGAQRKRLETDKAEKTVRGLLRATGGNVQLCRASEAKRVPPVFLKWVAENYRNKLIPIESVKNALKYLEFSDAELAELMNLYAEAKKPAKSAANAAESKT